MIEPELVCRRRAMRFRRPGLRSRFYRQSLESTVAAQIQLSCLSYSRRLIPFYLGLNWPANATGVRFRRIEQCTQKKRLVCDPIGMGARKRKLSPLALNKQSTGLESPLQVNVPLNTPLNALVSGNRVPRQRVFLRTGQGGGHGSALLPIIRSDSRWKLWAARAFRPGRTVSMNIHDAGLHIEPILLASGASNSLIRALPSLRNAHSHLI